MAPICHALVKLGTNQRSSCDGPVLGTSQLRAVVPPTSYYGCAKDRCQPLPRVIWRTAQPTFSAVLRVGQRCNVLVLSGRPPAPSRSHPPCSPSTPQCPSATAY